MKNFDLWKERRARRLARERQFDETVERLKSRLVATEVIDTADFIRRASE